MAAPSSEEEKGGEGNVNFHSIPVFDPFSSSSFGTLLVSPLLLVEVDLILLPPLLFSTIFSGLGSLLNSCLASLTEGGDVGVPLPLEVTAPFLFPGLDRNDDVGLLTPPLVLDTAVLLEVILVFDREDAVGRQSRSNLDPPPPDGDVGTLLLTRGDETLLLGLDVLFVLTGADIASAIRRELYDAVFVRYNRSYTLSPFDDDMFSPLFSFVFSYSKI